MKFELDPYHQNNVKRNSILISLTDTN